jgi:putative transposase
MEVSDVKEMWRFQDENVRLKKLVAEQTLDIIMLKDVNSRKW